MEKIQKGLWAFKKKSEEVVVYVGRKKYRDERNERI
jgi:hypothetical protein